MVIVRDMPQIIDYETTTVVTATVYYESGSVADAEEISSEEIAVMMAES